MVCPYCSFKNAPNALVCNQCGIILRLGRTSQLVPQASGGSGALSFVKSFLPGKLKGQQATRQARLEEILTAAQERYDAALKDPAQAGAARVHLAALALVQRELEKSLQWLQQAHQEGASGAEYFNNGGVALARRGQLPQAADMFEQAIKAEPALSVPYANRAHLFVLGGSEPDSNGAMQAMHDIQKAQALEPQNSTLFNFWGLILCREHLYEQARQPFGQAVTLAASNAAAQADAHNNLGLSYVLAGERDQGRYEFDAALKLDPSHAHALSNLGMEQMLDGSLAGGLEKLQRAARLDPQSGPVRANYGYGLCRIGAINDGILELKEAFGLEANVFETQYNLGKAYVDYGIYDIAERNLARALQIQPRSAEALIALGGIKARQGLLPQAIQYFQAVLRVTPTNTYALIGLGVCFALSGDYWEAGQNLQQAANVDGHNAEIASQLGWLNLLQDNMTAAEDELSLALQLDDSIAEAQNNIGLCFLDTGKPDEALIHLRRALTLNPALTAVHYQTGHAQALMKNPEAALKEWELTVRFEPANPDSHANRGVTFYKQGQLDDAVTEFRRVLPLRQNRMEDYSNLGLAYAKQGSLLRIASRNPQDPRMQQAKEKHRSAIDMFDRAIALDPSNAMLHSNRGLACFFAGRAEEAMQEWSMVSKLNPEYARRRGKAQQSEYDDSQIALVPISIPGRAIAIPPKTMGYQPRYLPGYDTEEWDLILSDPALAEAARLRREMRQAERSLNVQ